MDPLKTPVFWERVLFLRHTQFWPKESLEKLQVKKLQYLVKYVSENIAFYRDFLKKNKLTWEDFNKVEDVKKFPVITKDDIQKNYSKFLPIGIKKDKLLHRSTGGSTGKPLTIYMDLDFLSRDKANTEHYMEVLGLDIFNYKSIRLYGDKIPAELIKKREYWYKEDKKLVMSCYHINKDTVRRYVEKIKEHNPVYIHTRPSAILPLAKYILSERLKVKVKTICCDGEYLTDGQRDIIEKAFRGIVYNVYGHTEACTVGHSCKHSRLLHFMPQVGILELLDKDGNEVCEEGKTGEIVATGFNNKMFPLIRYRTKDMAVYTNKKCKCGRDYKMIKSVEGRIQDYVVDKNKNLVPLAPAIFNYNDMDWKGIKEFKVIQEEEGKLLFNVVCEKGEKITKRFIEDKIEQIFGNVFEIEVKFINELSRTKRGKFRYLDQKLEMSKYF